jgi:3-oxoacyl-[acyl-carrier protein] reductase
MTARTAEPAPHRVAVVTGTAQGIGAAIAAALKDDGITVHGIDKDTVDVTDSAAVNAFFAEIGEVDILVNNAGGVCGQVHHPVEDIGDEEWAAVVAANLTSAFNCTRAAVPAMTRQGWGRIGFVLSNPTTIEQWNSYGEAGQARLLETIAVRRLGDPQDIAHGVSFFVAERSSWITGETLSIDGGHARL